MNEKFELLKHIYRDAEMASYTIEELTKELKDKDNKIKNIIEDILKQYQDFLKETESLLKKHNVTLTETGLMSKMGAKMGIMKDVRNDNSDSSISEMLIKGISMGSIDMEKKIKDYEQLTDKESIKLAKDFLKFQSSTIEDLKKYL